MAGIFKAYDIRGIFGSGKEWDIQTVSKIGLVLPELLNAKKILVGRDARLSSPEISEALISALTKSGADVYDMGFATTPMVYFFTAEKNFDASIQITASHNPAEYNGLKISIKNAIPVGYETGLNELEKRVESQIVLQNSTRGNVIKVDYLAEYAAWLEKQKKDWGKLRFAIDCSNGMASILATEIFGKEAVYLNDTADGRFPNHPPNPLDPANCKQLSEIVKKEKFDLGIIFDGDADRVIFVDENGKFIQPDYLIPIIARELHPDNSSRRETVIHDIRTSRGVIETLQEDGFKTIMGKVGHAYAKRVLRNENAICGGELAGHYYFRDFHFCDSGELAAITILNFLAKTKQKFSEVISPIASRYVNSGEMNFKGISEKDEAINLVCHAAEKLAKVVTKETFDGIRLEFEEGWLNVRASNTEPCVRLLAEAKNQDLFDKLIETATGILKQFQK